LENFIYQKKKQRELQLSKRGSVNKKKKKKKMNLSYRKPEEREKEGRLVNPCNEGKKK